MEHMSTLPTRAVYRERSLITILFLFSNGIIHGGPTVQVFEYEKESVREKKRMKCGKLFLFSPPFVFSPFRVHVLSYSPWQASPCRLLAHDTAFAGKKQRKRCVYIFLSLFRLSFFFQTVSFFVGDLCSGFVSVEISACSTPAHFDHIRFSPALNQRPRAQPWER